MKPVISRKALAVLTIVVLISIGAGCFFLGSAIAYNAGWDSALEQGFEEEGFQSGYNQCLSERYEAGYNKRYPEGYSEGYDLGYMDGYDANYAVGYPDGKKQARHDTPYNEFYRQGYDSAWECR